MHFMNWIDLGFVICVALAAASGVRNGLSRSGLGLVAVILSFLVAAWMFPSSAVHFAIAFAVTVALISLAAHLLGWGLKTIEADWLDKPAGALVGALNGALMWTLVILALMSWGPAREREEIANSEVAPYAAEAIETISDAVPPEMKATLRTEYEKLQKRFPPKYRRGVPELRPREI